MFFIKCNNRIISSLSLNNISADTKSGRIVISAQKCPDTFISTKNADVVLTNILNDMALAESLTVGVVYNMPENQGMNGWTTVEVAQINHKALIINLADYVQT